MEGGPGFGLPTRTNSSSSPMKLAQLNEEEKTEFFKEAKEKGF